MSTEDAKLIRSTINEQFNLAHPSIVLLESVPLRRITFQSDALSILHRAADFHASIAKYFDNDNSVALLQFSKTTTNVDWHITRKSNRYHFLRWV
jgi:hypothetical protein